MKTLKDLFELINKETELNENKLLKNYFSVDTRYKWVGMRQISEYGEILGQKPEDTEEVIFSHKSIKTPEELQEVYWTIYNKGRLKSI
jgi:hypothetical protein